MSEKKDEKITEQEAIKPMAQTANIAASPENMIPKLCTGIGISVSKNKNMVLTMIHSEPPNAVANLIGRIVIDLEHAEALNKALTKILEDIKNGVTKFE